MEEGIIKDIDTSGFTVRKKLFKDEEGEIRLEWQNIDNVIVDYGFNGEPTSLQIFYSPINEEYFYLYPTNPNFYLLLSNIPQANLDNDTNIKLNSFQVNLKDCKICGFISVFNNECIVCGKNLNKILTRNTNWKYFNRIETIIKEEQIRYYSYLEFSTVAKFLNKHDRSFLKHERYKRLFTDEEFKEYEK